MYICCGILIIIVIILIIKVCLLHKATIEISKEYNDILSTDTNRLVSVQSSDKYIKKLAVAINGQLKPFCEERRRYQSGNTEIKEAITNISHDLRTPLTAISGYLEMLSREEKTSTVERYLSIVENRVDNLKELTEELFRYSLVISTSDDLKLTELSVNSVLEESIVAFYATLTETGIEPTISICERPVMRMADEKALLRVFQNIISNAVKYSDNDLDIVLDESGCITFSNTAPSLNEVQAGRLLDRFYTVENGSKSTGLGLSIAKALMDKMGGSISTSYESGRLIISIEI